MGLNERVPEQRSAREVTDRLVIPDFELQSFDMMMMRHRITVAPMLGLGISRLLPSRFTLHSQGQIDLYQLRSRSE